MDINAQIKVLEALLKKDENKECADCCSKTPRWASITFGTFVCLRCSGHHRNLQVHITKIKSVNLDKWAPEMVEMYKHVSNVIINTYWEARLPGSFQKPGQGASSKEIETFIRDKYLQKKWADPSMKQDIAGLYWTDRKKFDRLIKNFTEGAQSEEEEEDSDEERKRKERRKQRKAEKALKAEQEKHHEPKKQFSMPPAQTKPIEDLISFDSKPQHSDGFDGFNEFQGQPQVDAIDGFNDFQGSTQQTQVNSQSINLQSLYSMYNQNPTTSVSQTVPNKYAALDSIGGFSPPPQQFMPQQQMYPQQPMGGFNGMQNYQQMQQRPPQQQFMGQPPNAQNNMFSGLNMTINVNQYAGQNAPQQFPQMMGQGVQSRAPQQFPMGGFQPNQYNAQPSGQGGLYGGLVNLNNLGGSAPQQQNSGFSLGGQAQQKKQSDAFSGLMDGKW